jgi:hypothetical protein
LVRFEKSPVNSPISKNMVNPRKKSRDNKRPSGVKVVDESGMAEIVKFKKSSVNI